MMIESKIKESEYRERFASAPDIPRRRKQRADEIEVKTEKIGMYVHTYVMYTQDHVGLQVFSFLFQSNVTGLSAPV